MNDVMPRGAAYLGDAVQLDLPVLEAGHAVTFAAPDGIEAALVLLSGDITFDGQRAHRADVFAHPATAVYLPPGTSIDVAANTHSELALAATVGGELHAPPGAAPAIVTPADVVVNDRGRDGWQRAVHDVIADTVPAQRLLVGETFNTAGQWSSFPPHKHDGGDGEPALEEVYYYRFDRPDGFGFQGLYELGGRGDTRCSSGTASSSASHADTTRCARRPATASTTCGRSDRERARRGRSHCTKTPRTAGCTRPSSARCSYSIFNTVIALKGTRDRPVAVHTPDGATNIVVTVSVEPLNRPDATGPDIVCAVGFPDTTRSETADDDDCWVFHTIVAVPLVFVFAPCDRVVQLLAMPYLRFADSVPPVTLPPLQPVILAPWILTVGFTFELLESFGNAGENDSVPVSDLHVVPPAAPAGVAIGASTRASVVASTALATLRMPGSLMIDDTSS